MVSEDSMKEDAELLTRIANADTAAEERLLRKYGERILVCVRIQIGYHEETKDLCQEILLALLQAARKGNVDDPRKLWQYVSRICSNKVADWLEDNKYPHHRKKTDSEVIESSKHKLKKIGIDNIINELIDPAKSPLEQMITEEKRVEVDKSLRRLPEKKRRILRLIYFDEKEYGEIAQTLNLTYDAIRKAKSVALKKLNRILAID